MYPKLCQSNLFDVLLIDCLRLVEKIEEMRLDNFLC